MSDGTGKLVELVAGLKSRGATEKEIKKSFYTYIENKAREKRIPLHGSLELTPLCNLDCGMCYVHLESKQFDINSLLSAEIWKGLISEAHDAGMLYCTLTGGECLTYSGFDEIYLFLRQIGCIPSVATNGLLLDRDRIDFFTKSPPGMIQVTLYGSCDDAYEKVTGYRVFNTVYHNLEMLREANLKAVIAITPNLYMRDDIRPLVEAADSLGLPYGINANLVTPRGSTGRQLKDLEIDEYIEIYKVYKDLRREEQVPVDLRELPDEGGEGSKTCGLQCGGGRSSFTIQYNGKMSPCPSLGEITTDPLTEGFMPAWRRLNYIAESFPMPEECPGCVYRDCCLPCPAIHGNAGKPGHCDPRICERTKRLIREGFIPIPGKNERK